MGTLTELQNEKNKILSAISKAAGEGKADTVLAESERLEKIENLISRQKQIRSELDGLRSGTPQTAQLKIRRIAATPVGESRSAQMVSSRELGEQIRSEFLRKREAEGIHLQLIKGKTIFRTRSGKRVGLAVATERQPNRWFLGLPAGGFDHAVLLCQRENGEVIDIPLPEKFFEKYGREMSESKGQLKFNVVNRGSGLLVQVPGTDGINGKSFTSDYSFLS
ncbi:hypothetical protein [Geoalkalibacter halelectricus]|uniref:Uncharacterized protein n=1 Tax=Geoalkalibacter halelectricus TaxID=2847045 RepID=A0ABY5ZKP0_9BACT|nr:hypothetical protein [Geoalkalibacter halelectricus]MDO3377099.1 hypothetical protein [Geoalkalibacter halelectricus]UWZ79404.1 hypothetical protein L9S41_17235 [Geoalkalibacter halelectricus]